MQILGFFIDLLLHMDKMLPELVAQYHNFVYLFLFLIIFCETGLVVTPFLPGDSLIFAAATLAASGHINGWVLFPLLCAASILGDNSNFRIGCFLSDKVRSRRKIRFIKTEYIDRTHRYFEKHGAATVIIAKFMPIIRTFSPFVAGVGTMTFRRFFVYDLIGGLSWVTLFFTLGTCFGKLPAVQEHFSFVVLGIIAISLLPAVIIFLKEHFSSHGTAGSGD